jgi:23S rRNA (cytosine1962-C5)-methyltransferase
MSDRRLVPTRKGATPAALTLKSASAASSIARGHPWVWRDAVARGLDGVQPGDEVRVLAPDGAPVGRGIADPGSPIAVRIWTRDDEPLGPGLWQERARAACALRRWLFAGSRTTAFRVVHGEGDRMPGFVLDRYAAVAVAKADGEAAASRIEDFAEAIWPELHDLGVETLVARTSEKGQSVKLDCLRGPPPPVIVHVEEHGVPFAVDLAHGQKTGAFLDQRENRRRVGELARGRRVLNLFSYTGGFGLHAALGGAAHVTNVDVATAAHATAQESMRMAGVDPAAHAFVTADAQAFLDRARQSGQRWDLVVSDPPSFAPNEKALPRALAAYRALHAGCAAVLAPGAILCAASCSSHVDPTAFLGTLDDAALGRGDMTLLELRGAGEDHPTLPAFPQGRYLKFAVLAGFAEASLDVPQTRSRS